MKKLLALVLALVMTLGLATVGTNAALSDFSDADQVSNEEAMAVMNAVGVFVGSDGKLDPKGNLTRAQAAKLIAYLDLGETASEALPKTGSKFTDVPDGAWYTGYVNYMVQAGFTSGTSATTFSPDGQLNGYQFGAFLLAVLGYDRAAEGMTGSGWETKVAVKMEECGITDGVDKLGSATLTREEAAQFCLNALKATCVSYPTAATTVTTSDGTKVTTGGGSASQRAAYAGIDYTADTTVGNTTLELCEKLYGNKLLLTATAPNGMGEPASQWTYKTEAVGTYASDADYTYVVVDNGKTDAEIIDKISKSLTGENTATWTVNGGAYTYGTDTLVVGDIVKVWIASGTANTVNTVAITRYTASKVTAAVATKGSGKDLEIRVPGVCGYTAYDKISGYEDLAKDDYAYYYTDANGNITIGKASVVEGQLTYVSSGATPKYTIGGTQYKANRTVNPTINTYNSDYKYYLDDNGFIVAAVAVDKESKDYVVIQAIDYVEATGVQNNGYVEARLVKMDGTTQIVKIDSVKVGGNTYTGISTADYDNGSGGNTTDRTDTTDHKLVFDGEGDHGKYNIILSNTVANEVNHSFFTYQTNSDGEYQLTQVTTRWGGLTTATVAKKAASITGTADAGTTLSSAGRTAVNDSTVFVIVKENGGNKYNVYTGKANVPTITTAAGTNLVFLNNSSGIAEYVFVYGIGSTPVNTEDVILLTSTDKAGDAQEKINGNTVAYELWDAIVKGEATQVKVSASVTEKTSTGSDDDGTLEVRTYTPTYNTDGIITELKQATADNAYDNGTAVQTGYSFSGTTLVGSSASYTVTTDRYAFVKDTDGNISKVSVSELDKDSNDYVRVVRDNSGDVDYLFIIENSDSNVSLTAAPVVKCGGALTATSVVGNTYTYNLAVGKASTAITINLTPAGVGTTTQYKNTNGQTSFTAFTTGTDTNVGNSATAGNTQTVTITVTSVDNTVGTYTFIFNTAAA